jgi:hypothetical protein
MPVFYKTNGFELRNASGAQSIRRASAGFAQALRTRKPADGSDGRSIISREISIGSVDPCPEPEPEKPKNSLGSALHLQPERLCMAQKAYIKANIRHVSLDKRKALSSLVNPYSQRETGFL